MIKKLLCALLCVVLCGSVFTGCTLIVHNDKKDAMQVIATVQPVVEKSEQGEIIFQSTPRYIYKSQLNAQLNQNLQTYMQQNPTKTQAEAVNHFLTQLVQQQLLIVESERRLAIKDLEWGQKQDNQLMQNIYSTIDSQLKTIRNDILVEAKETTNVLEDEKTEDEKSTTYPVKKEETTDEDFSDAKRDENGNVLFEKNDDGSFKLDKDGNKIPQYIIWSPDKARYPGVYGNDDDRSLENESVHRFVQLLKDLVKDDFRVTEKNKADFKADDAAIADAWTCETYTQTNADGEKISVDGGAAAVYLYLGKSHYIDYLVGQSVRESIKIQLLQNYLIDSVAVTDEEVKSNYNTTLKAQQTGFAVASAYKSAITGTETIYHHPNANYFYVKHILLPFSDAQKVDLKSHEKDSNYVAYRNDMVNNMVVYEHVGGEDDKSNPKTVKAVFDEVNSVMLPLASSVKEADRAFTDLIYKYNTDGGIFEKALGYAVERDSSDNSGYMKEFYDSAIDLYNTGEPGQVLSEYAVTDYGVHVMYFASRVLPGDVALNAYQTPAQEKTYFEVLKEKSKTDKETKAFDDFADVYVTSRIDKSEFVIKYPKRYKNLTESK